MDINEYIASGILEQYVLGSVSPQEKQEVECMSNIYPELNTHLVSLQNAVEKMADKAAVPAPKHLKALVMQEIAKTPQLESENSESTANQSGTPKLAIHKSDNGNKFKYLAAACLVGFALVTGLALFQNNIKNDIKNQLVKSENQLLEVQSEVSDLEEIAAYNTAQLAFISEKATRKITLAGTKGNKNNEAVVFWNSESQKVILDQGKLASLPEGQQYQLWAIADGVPVDMGMINQQELNTELAEMKSTGNAQAFAITIEPKGGSKTPTLEKMVVLGEV